MGEDLKFAINLAPFDRLCDRFVSSGYCEGYEFRKQLEKLAEIEGMTGVDLTWPTQFRDGIALKKILQEHGLKLASVDTDIYTEAMFKLGSLTNPDSRIRRASIDRVKGAIDAAEAAGAPNINLWPGHDGFDYLFQGIYTDAWKWLVEGLREIAEYNPKVPIGIEPKCKEPRANIYVANTGKALFLVNKINRPHMGITLDYGHSLAALENPAEAAALTLQEGRLVAVHLNDNYRDWDHDLIPGSVTVWEHIEFFYWLRKLGYSGWYDADVYPYREDGSECCRRTVQILTKCWHISGKLMETNIEELQRAGGHLKILGMLWEMVKP